METLKLKLRVLIDGYSKTTQIRRYISRDIIELIAIFYGFLLLKKLILTARFCIRERNWEVDDLKVEDISTTKTYTVSMNSRSIIPDATQRSTHSDIISQMQEKSVAYKCKLPYQLIQKYGDMGYTTSSILESNEWILLFQDFSDSDLLIRSSVSQIVAVHPQFHDHDSFRAIQHSIPKPPTEGPYSKSRVIYNKTAEKMFKFERNLLYSLDLSKLASNKWIKWKSNINPIVEDGASFCMVDNDRFMAVINQNKRQSYLYSMDDNKLCIRLKDACAQRWMNISMYHDINHKIITAGCGGIECYDFNKDKCMMLKTYYNDPKYFSNIWYSTLNPDVLFCCDMRKWIYSFDLRTNQLFPIFNDIHVKIPRNHYIYLAF